MLTKYNLHAYQIEAIKRSFEEKRIGIFVEMGAGKTIIALSVIWKVLKFNPSANILIISPSAVIDSVWMIEYQKWSFLRNFLIKKIKGSNYPKQRFYDPKCNIYAIADTLLTNWQNYHKKHIIEFWDLIIVDESHVFKSHASKKTKTLRRMNYDRMMILTATPIPNGFEDLFPQIDFIDQEQRLGRNITEYRRSFFMAVNRANFTEYQIDKRNKQRILKLISPLVFRISNDQRVIPKFITHSFEMEGQYEAQYEKIKKDLILYLDGLDEGSISDPLIIQSGAVKSLKLLQFCNGFVYDEDKIAHPINNQKATQLIKLVNSLQPRKLIIAYYFKYDLEILKKIYPNAIILDKKKKEVIQAWNNKLIDILLVHPQSAGHGLNLQGGGYTMIWYSFNYSLLYYQQMIGRIARQGQTNPVTIHHLINKGKIDEFVLNIINKKDFIQKKFLKYLKNYLK